VNVVCEWSSGASRRGLCGSEQPPQWVFSREVEGSVFEIVSSAPNLLWARGRGDVFH